MAQTGAKSTKAAVARPSAVAKKSTKAAVARPSAVAKKSTSAELKRAAARTADLSEAVLKSVETGQLAALDAVRKFLDAVAAALPASPYAHGIGTASLLAEDVTADPLLPVEGRLVPRRVLPDLLLGARS